jgi:hypothetical protein
VETSAIQANQYRHLIYLKEMEAVYYRTKCEQFLANVDVIVNAKMSHKGNHIIYELDVTNRELRTLKDHYYLMERELRAEIGGEFRRSLEERGNELKRLGDANGEFRTKLRNEMSLQVDEVLGEQATKGITALLEEAADPSKNIKPLTATSRRQGPPPEVTEEQIAQQLGSIQNYQEILRLEKALRRMKVQGMMKEVLRQEKHEKQIAELKQKLTMNGTLWEQLAESQKREQITR